jgi:hypothetical protein
VDAGLIKLGQASSLIPSNSQKTSLNGYMSLKNRDLNPFPKLLLLPF